MAERTRYFKENPEGGDQDVQNYGRYDKDGILAPEMTAGLSSDGR